LSGVLTSFYDYLASLGQYCGRYTYLLFKGLFTIIKKPIVFMFAAFASLYRGTAGLVFRTFKAVLSETKLFVKEVKDTSERIKNDIIANPKKAPSIIWGYILKAIIRHRVVFKYFLNLILPILGLLLLIYTINHWNRSIFALEININGETIGYVSAESVFVEARDIAKDRLGISSGFSAMSTTQLLDAPVYSLSLIKINQLTDADTIADKLIERSASNITNACGIYINDEFLCAVKNETDAKRVFDSLLAPYEESGEYDVVSFVEKIDYVQGLYPDTEDIMWDAARLKEKLQSKKQESLYYKIEEGDLVSTIASKFGVTSSQIRRLNPNLDEKRLRIGQEILVSEEVPFIRVKTAKIKVTTEVLPYKTVEVLTDAYYQGTKKTIREGVNGTQQVTSLVTYINGTEYSTEEISRVTIKEPVDKRVQVGTKKYSGSSPSSGGGKPTKYTGAKLTWPVIGAYSISSGYGYRNRAMHRGVDIVASGGSSKGKVIVAAASGTVTKATYHSSWGYYVMIDHGNGLQTLYAHCLKGSLMVRPGQRVSAGQAIARVGSTGNSSGYHLHFEVWRNGARVNPLPYLGR